MRRKRRQRLRRHQGRTIPLKPDVVSALEEQREAFRRKFGREPRPDDPVFFDPDADTPQPFDLGRLDTAMTEAMTKAGLDPAFIYAYRRTGLIVTEQNECLLTEDDRQAWRNAVAEYEDMIGRGPI